MMSFIWFVISKKRFVRLERLTFPTAVDLSSCSKEIYEMMSCYCLEAS